MHSSITNLFSGKPTDNAALPFGEDKKKAIEVVPRHSYNHIINLMYRITVERDVAIVGLRDVMAYVLL